MKVPVKQFLSAFFKINETVHIRVFPERKQQDGFKGKNYSITLNSVDSLISELQEQNRRHRGIFFVVNAGGHYDKEISRINAQFFESDSLTLEQQMEQIKSFKLEPSILVKTRKSLHVYYLMKEAVKENFRKIQQQLIKQFNGDPQCINESRVFRLPGFYHCKEKPVMVECIKFSPDIRYTQKELEEYLPDITEGYTTLQSHKSQQPMGLQKVNQMQKGLERVCFTCLFLRHCKSNAKELSEHDWFAMITNLAIFEGGRDRIHEYSKPYKSYSFEETEEKINKFFKSGTKPIYCRTIAQKGFKCPKLPYGCKCGSPAGMSYIPVETQYLINIVGKMEVLEQTTQNVDLINQFINNWLYNVERTIAESIIDNEIKSRFKLKSTKNYKEYYKRLVGIVENDHYKTNKVDFSKSLEEMLFELNSLYFSGKPPINKVTDNVIEWFIQNGVRFYRNVDDKCYMYYAKQLVYLGKENLAFTSLLYTLGKINAVTYEGKCIIQALRDFAFNQGQRIETASWIHEMGGSIYINLHQDDNNIAKISPSRVELIQNGSNEDGIVLLNGATRVKEIEYLSDVDIRYGLKLLKACFIDNLACSNENKLLVTCYALAVFLKDSVQAHPIAKFSGISGSGKSIAAKLVTTLIYGEEQLTNNTIAANYASAARDPVIVMENKEARDLTNEELNFIITIATGIIRGKRKSGTETETTVEKANCLVIITAIEPFNISEIIDRVYDIEFDKQYHKNIFMESKVLKELKANRSVILSAVFKLLSGVLKEFEKKKSKMFQKLLQNKHVKERTNDFLSILCVIANAILEYYPDIVEVDSQSYITKWAQTFNQTSEETKEGTNVNLFLLNYILDILRKNCSEHYLPSDDEKREGKEIVGFAGDIVYDNDKNVIGFVTTSARLFAAFAMVAKQLNLSEDYRYINARQLGIRLKNDTSFLERFGWTISQDKTINGIRYKRFEHSFK